jgi:hypothetical protein
MSTENENDPINNAFANNLASLREGQTLNELSEALVKLTQRVRQTGKSGAMVFTLKVIPASKGAGNALMFTGKVATKLPEFETESTIFFVDDDYSLHREDPRQKKLDLKEVPKAPPAELKTAVNQ